MNTRSINFQFLAKHDPVLDLHAALVEKYVFEDPNAALFRIRQLAETLVKTVAAHVGLGATPDEKFVDIERALFDRGVIDSKLKTVIRTVRMAGNHAAHTLAPGCRTSTRASVAQSHQK